MVARYKKARNFLLGFCFLVTLHPLSFAQSAIEHKDNSFNIIPSDDIYADSARFYLKSFETTIADLLNSSLDTTVTVYIADSESEFRQWGGGSIPDWGAGAASIEQAVIIIKSPKYISTGKSFKELLGHELTHIMLYRAAGGRWLPRWLHEGLAMHVSGEWNIGQDVLVARAAWTKNLIRLQRLESLSEFNGAQANLAYTESYLAVSSLLGHIDRYIIADLLELYRQNNDFYKSFRLTIGADYVVWINDWYDRTSIQYHFFLFIFDQKIFWLVPPLLIILIFIYKKRQSAKIKRRWKIEERLHPPDDSYNQYYDGYYDEEDKI